MNEWFLVVEDGETIAKFKALRDAFAFIQHLGENERDAFIDIESIVDAMTEVEWR